MAEIVDPTVICRNFPTCPMVEILRDNLLDTLDRIFQGGTGIVSMEGTDGIGKTILLRQFALRHHDRSISLFIQPISRLSYAPEYLRLALAEQVHWIVSGNILDTEIADESLLRTLLIALQKRSIRERAPYYFCIDGLDEIPRDDPRNLDFILKDLLPLGMSGFRFLFTGDFQPLFSSFTKSTAGKPFSIPFFSLDDSSRYLSPLNLGPQAVEDLHRMCKGIPGHLAVVARLLHAGTSVSTLLEQDLDNLPDFLAMEWRTIDLGNPLQQRFLSVLAYGRRPYTLDELAAILHTDEGILRTTVLALPVLALDPVRSLVTFISNSHRQYARRLLQDHRDTAHGLLIDYLLTNAAAESTLVELPGYFEQAGRLTELLDHLTPDHFSLLIEHDRSLSQVYRRADLGLRTAKKLNRHEAVIRFTIQKTLLSELDAEDIWRAEIEARMSLGEYSSALTLAQGTAITEDRFHLLAIIAKIQAETHGLVDPELMEQIKLLYDQLDHKALGDRAAEIAADLVMSDPDLAIRLVEAATDSEQDANALDLAFTKLSLSALHSDAPASSATVAFEKTAARIRDPKTQQFLGAASLLYGEASAADVVARVNKLEPKNRLFYLRRWALRNQSSPEAARLLEYALDTLVQNSIDTPTTRSLRELATALTGVTDTSVRKSLIGRFDSQRASVEHLGATIEFVRLQLLLAQAEAAYDQSKAAHRVIEAYWVIRDVHDLGTRSECMAWMLTALDLIDPAHLLETREGLHTLTAEELESDVRRILDTTADQLKVLVGVLRALAPSKPQLAKQVAEQLNIQPRRDKGFAIIIKALSDGPATSTDWSFAKALLDSIEEGETRDDSYVDLMTHLDTVPSGTLANSANHVLSIVDDIPSIHSAEDRCRVSCIAYSVLSKHLPDRLIHVSARILSLLRDSWESIDPGWRKVHLGFHIATQLSPYARDLAIEYLRLAEGEQRTISGDADTSIGAYVSCISLAIRAYSGLLPRNVDTPEDLQRLTDLIMRIPSYGERINLWSELAIRLFTNERADLGRHIVNAHVRPLLAQLPPANRWYKWRALDTAAAALYCAHPLTAFDAIAALPQPDRDTALDSIAEFLLRKQPSSEPYSSLPGEGHTLTYEDAVSICDVLSRISTDSYLYYTIQKVADSLISKKNRDRITRQHRLDIADRLEPIVKNRLPDLTNIRHNGFRIASEAHIARLRHSLDSVWSGLVAEARAIPNIADRAYVLSIIAAIHTTKEGARRDEILKEAVLLIESIPADVDRIERLVGIAELVVDVDILLTKKCLRSAIEGSLTRLEDDSLQESHRRAIDLAHHIDPSYAASLASLADTDPARAAMRSNLRQRLDLLETKQDMAGQGGSLKAQEDPENYSRAAWMNLGSLNAKRIQPVHADALLPYLDVAAKLPLHDAYPILAWMVQNNVVRLARSDQARALLVPTFEATVLAAELGARLAARSSVHVRSTTSLVRTATANQTQIVVTPGEREAALQFIAEWLHGVADYLKICDPFFGPEDLEVLKIVAAANPDCRVSILTSRKRQDSVAQPWEESYRTHWRLHVSDIDPPDTDIVIAGREVGGDSPIHDRWWITNGAGLRLGTSFGSLGRGKSSEIAALTSVEADMREKEIDQYLVRKRREQDGVKLRYVSFTL